jgi:protein-S-isoprenylcysteine O-methyltransferase Ste14
VALQESLEKQGNFLFRYRSFLPLLILAVGVIVFYYNLQNGLHAIDSEYLRLEFVSLIAGFFGLAIRIIAVGHTPANTSGRNTKEQLADEVNTSGIYSTVRHPLYLGNFFMWLGAVLLVGNHWFTLVFALAYWIYYERIMFAEEQFLRRKFGEKYISWAGRTPAFVPSLKNKVKSIYPFSIKKVLKKEKNGVLAIFVLLFLFHNLRNSVVYHSWSIRVDWVLWSALVSGIVYLVLKLIKKNTNWLDEKGR